MERERIKTIRCLDDKTHSMKKIFLSFIFFPSSILFANTPESTQEVSSPVKSVILYLDGAEVTHNAQVNLSAGRNKIVFVGLSTKLVSKSVQVNVSNDVSILSVSDKVNYLSKQQQNLRIKQLKDSVEFLNNNSKLLQNEKDAYETEKKMLIANQYIGGQNTGVALAALKSSADFFLERIKEINGEVYKIDRKQEKITEAVIKIDNELLELNAKFNQPTAEITVLLSANAKVSATIELKYLVVSSGWAPIYDLRAEDVDKPISLKYKANVYNNSGVDWNDVKLKLSTADPMQSASQPQFNTWWLDYQNNYDHDLNPNYLYNNTQNDNESIIDADKKSQQEFQQMPSQNINSVLSTAPGVSIRGGRQNFNGSGAIQQNPSYKKDNITYEEIQVPELSAEFDIKIPYTIPSDAKPYLVEVTDYKLPATYQHFCAPKLDKDVFLLARITGWEDLNLVEGPANVYYAGTYVGRSFIYIRSTDDTLNLSLGRDRKVIVTRTKQQDLTSTKYIGTNKKESYAYEFVVKNNRKNPINIEIQDQLPVSKQGDISVDILEISKAQQDVITGKLSWNLSLASDETKKFNLAFTIKYPKNKSITKSQAKARYRAKF